MTSSTPSQKKEGRTDPFTCGLPKDVVVRLLSGHFERRDLDRYYGTDHFRLLKPRVIDSYGSCVLCGCRDQNRLTAHHRHYKSLFREDVLKVNLPRKSGHNEKGYPSQFFVRV